MSWFLSLLVTNPSLYSLSAVMKACCDIARSDLIFAKSFALIFSLDTLALRSVNVVSK